MPSSQKIGSFRPLTFLSSNKPVRPVRPQIPNREPGRLGIQFSGAVTYGEFVQNIRSFNNLDFRTLGKAAVKLQKSLGISINITV